MTLRSNNQKRRTSIYWKILANSFLLISLMGGMIFLTYLLYNAFQERNDIRMVSSSVSEVQLLREQLNRQHDRYYSVLFSKNKIKIATLLNHIDSLLVSIDDKDNLIDLKRLNYLYRSYIEKYEAYQFEIGLDEETGIEKYFRDNAHSIEGLIKEEHNLTGYKIYNVLLQLRRREKDYKLREHQKYISNIETLLQELNSLAQTSNLSIDKKKQINQLSKSYWKHFNKYVSIRTKITSTEQEIVSIENDIIEKIDALIVVKTGIAEQWKHTQIIAFILSIILSIFLSVYIARGIARPVIHLQKATLRITEGDYTFKAKVQSRDEIEDLAHFFNDMMENINVSNKIIVEQNKQLQDLNATKDKFFSIIAHDLKNPLSAFSGIASFVNSKFDDLDDIELRSFIEDMDNSSKYLFELLENLLTWARVQRRQVPYNPTFLDISQIINNNIYLLKLNADNKKIALSSKVEPDTIVFADPNMINTVLRNLITNAIKFTPEGGTIKVYNELLPEKNMMSITVKDTGVGMSDKEKEQLFKLDNHITTEGTNHEKGTGLGLILCQEFMQINEGEINIKSKVGNGTKVTISLPVRKGGFVK